MYEKNAHIVSSLKDFLLDHYDPELIILYGSTARGDTDEFSDIDMMVIMDVEDSEKLAAEMLAETDHIVHDKHIILRSSDDYCKHRDIPGTMVYSALIEGLILFQRSGFDASALPLKSYEERKRDVIEKEYFEQACDFLEMGLMSLDSKQLFRCRDYLRFTTIRMLKAVFVFRDVNPPRDTDLEVLFERARELLPEIEKISPVIPELNNFIPSGNEPEDISKCRYIVDKTRFVIDCIVLFLN